jgi:hypothetical protein
MDCADRNPRESRLNILQRRRDATSVLQGCEGVPLLVPSLYRAKITACSLAWLSEMRAKGLENPEELQLHHNHEKFLFLTVLLLFEQCKIHYW